MGYISTEALVIQNKPYSNTSQLVRLFSKDFGQLNCLCKGSFRKKSSFDGPLTNLLLIQATIYDKHSEGDLFLLINSFILHYYRCIYSDIKKFAISQFLLELLNKISFPSNREPELYVRTVGYLEKLNTSDDVNISEFYNFLINILEALGYSANHKKYTPHNDNLFDFVFNFMQHQLDTTLTSYNFTKAILFS